MVFAFVFDSVGFGEWFLLLAVVLIVVGPKNLPSTARKIGSYYSKFRRAAESFKRQLMDMDTQIDQVVNDAIGEDAFAGCTAVTIYCAENSLAAAYAAAEEIKVVSESGDA